MATPALFKSHLEVERKFLPTLFLKALLQGTRGEFDGYQSGNSENIIAKRPVVPLSFFRLPHKLIRVTYYDLGSQLANEVVTFPLINDGNPSKKWEAKLRLAGDYADSQFVEVEGESRIRDLLLANLPGTSLEQLEVVADLETHRSTWVVVEARGMKDSEQPELRIDLDEVTAPTAGCNARHEFKHHVGELEMTRDVVGGANEVAHGELRKQVAQSMHRSVDNYLERYGALFPCTPKPKGKVGAYHDWKKSMSGDSDID